MKSPSMNIGKSLAGQAPAGNSPETVMVAKQRPMSPAGMVLPGEGNVTPMPGQRNERAATVQGKAVGSIFGGN